jgi:5'-3' exoribonuclease 2
MSIAAGVISAIMVAYQQTLPKFYGYITKNGVPHVAQLATVISRLTKFKGRALESIVCAEESVVHSEAYENTICDSDEWDAEPLKGRPESPGKTHHGGGRASPSQTLKADYYARKFGDLDSSEIVAQYAKGMSWALKYYTHGCPSWGWFYPFLFPPCASDFSSASDIDEFELGEPFRPLVQLMAVLPPQSAHALPLKLQDLMLDETSPLKQFFPTSFRVDMFGQRTTWKAIVLIPFIDADLMVTTIEKVDLELTEEERQRNVFGRTRIFTEAEKVGVVVWGKVEKIDGNEFFFEYPIVAKDQELAFVLLNAQLPPDINVNSKSRDRQNFHLHTPGYPPGETEDARSRLVASQAARIKKFLF